MKLAISNIAWTKEEEPEMAKLLLRLGVKYVEIAPTKLMQDPTQATEETIRDYRSFWENQGISIVAFQSMLFNRPDLKIFENKMLRNSTLEYLKAFIKLAPKFGAGVMVFGSPKNRQKGTLPENTARTIADSFFSKLGTIAQANHTIFCIEPNPIAYACDFITTAQQGIDFVQAVDNKGIGLHLDIAGMTLAGDDIVASIKAASGLLKHFHISAPFLGQVEEGVNVQYKEAAEALRGINFDGYVSIEMKPEQAGENLLRVEKAIRFAQQIF
jgi:sugar phosphate isomerase/epimerase